MTGPVQLRGIAWDHPRGVDPLRATARRFQSENPDITITWDARSLRDFEDQPVSVLAESYDLLTVDHPFIGTAAQQGVLLPLDEWLTSEFLADQAANSVGASNASYQWEGHQWALAIDESAQTSACRADLLQHLDMAVPRTWAEVAELAKAVPPEHSIAMPLDRTHLFSCFLSMCSNRLDPEVTATEASLTRWMATGSPISDIAMEVIEDLYKLSSYLAPLSFSADPIGVLDAMSTEDSVPYAPVIFAYCTYSRPGGRRRLVNFRALPSIGPTPRGALLGGVGLAVSSRCPNPEVAVNYVQEVASGPWQRGIYAESGGQPGHRSAWKDPAVNLMYNNFFDAILETLDLSFVRPRVCCYPRFQQQAGSQLHRMFMERDPPAKIVTKLSELWRESVDVHQSERRCECSRPF